MKKCKMFLSITAVELLAVAAMIAYGRALSNDRSRVELPEKASLVKSLGLTDLAIWTEARYTRHPSQADFFTPFQDFPSALEHFPAGSVVSPETLRGTMKQPVPPERPD